MPHAIHVVKEGIEQLQLMNETPVLITLKNIFLKKDMLQKSFNLRLKQLMKIFCWD